MGIVGIIKAATAIITDVLIPLVFALCLMFFFWGVVKYIWSVGNEKEEGRRVMIWGIVGLFVAFSIWGIIKFIQNELGILPINNIEKSSTPYVNSTITY